MKTGIIVYVVGEGVKDCEFDEKEAASKLDVKADRVEFVFSGQTAGDLAYSWFHMTVKGMSRIVCMVGELAGASAVTLTGRQMQLAGY